MKKEFFTGSLFEVAWVRNTINCIKITSLPQKASGMVLFLPQNHGNGVSFTKKTLAWCSWPVAMETRPVQCLH